MGGFANNAPIVTDGLVFYVDAGNDNSYPGSGDTWLDLIGGNDGSFNNMDDVNNPSNNYDSANGGSIVFDGTDEEVTTTFNNALGDFTACAWFKSTGLNIYERVLDKSYANGFWIGRSSNNANQWGGGIKQGQSPFGIFITLSDGDWHYIVSRRSGSTHTILGDGITNTVSQTLGTDLLNTNLLRIGHSDQPNGDELEGNIGLVKIYNRALTDAEILQNYNALKNRFV